MSCQLGLRKTMNASNMLKPPSLSVPKKTHIPGPCPPLAGPAHSSWAVEAFNSSCLSHVGVWVISSKDLTMDVSKRNSKTSTQRISKNKRFQQGMEDGRKLADCGLGFAIPIASFFDHLLDPSNSQWSQRPNLPHKLCPKYHRNIPLPVKFHWTLVGWAEGVGSVGSVGSLSSVPLGLDVDAGGDASTQIDGSFVLAQGCHLVAKPQHVFERFWQTPISRTEAKMKSFHSQFGNSSPSHFIFLVLVCL